MENQNFTKEEINGVSIETINLKRVTIKEAETFKKILTEEIEEGKRKIIVNFNQCEYIDSTFLGALVVNMKKIKPLGGEIRLAAAKGSTRSILEITGASKFFKVYSTLEAALSSFDAEEKKIQ
jgi:anti-sigma B factor antagonist